MSLLLKLRLFLVALSLFSISILTERGEGLANKFTKCRITFKLNFKFLNGFTNLNERIANSVADSC